MVRGITEHTVNSGSSSGSVGASRRKPSLQQTAIRFGNRLVAPILAVPSKVSEAGKAASRAFHRGAQEVGLKSERIMKATAISTGTVGAGAIVASGILFALGVVNPITGPVVLGLGVLAIGVGLGALALGAVLTAGVFAKAFVSGQTLVYPKSRGEEFPTDEYEKATVQMRKDIFRQDLTVDGKRVHSMQMEAEEPLQEGEESNAKKRSSRAISKLDQHLEKQGVTKEQRARIFTMSAQTAASTGSELAFPEEAGAARSFVEAERKGNEAARSGTNREEAEVARNLAKPKNYEALEEGNKRFNILSGRGVVEIPGKDGQKEYFGSTLSRRVHIDTRAKTVTHYVFLDRSQRSLGPIVIEQPNFPADQYPLQGGYRLTYNYETDTYRIDEIDPRRWHADSAKITKMGSFLNPKGEVKASVAEMSDVRQGTVVA